MTREPRTVTDRSRSVAPWSLVRVIIGEGPNLYNFSSIWNLVSEKMDTWKVKNGNAIFICLSDMYNGFNNDGYWRYFKLWRYGANGFCYCSSHRFLINKVCIIHIIKWGASSRWSLRPISACGSIETTTMRKTHPTLPKSIKLKRGERERFMN